MRRSSLRFVLSHVQWLLLLVAAPFLLLPSSGRTFLILAVLCIFLINFILSRKPFPVTPLNTSLLLVLLMVLISTWATYDLMVSLEKITGLIFGLCIFCVVVQHGQNRREWRLILVSFLLIGLGITCLGLLGTRWFIVKFQALNTITHLLPGTLRGLPGAEDGFQPNEVAGTLLWSILVMLSVFIASILKKTPFRSLRPRWFLPWLWSGLEILILGGMALLTTGVFLLAQSRGGYLALGITLVLIMLLALPPAWRKPVLITGVILCAVTAVVLLSFHAVPFLNNLLFAPENVDNPALPVNSLQGRLGIWSAAVYAIRDFPLTGMGMNTFRYAGRLLYPLFIDPNFNLGHAHNEFLQAALDLGLPGLVAFLSIYAVSFWMLFRLFQRAERGEAGDFPLKTVVLGLGGGLFAHFLFGLTDAVALGAKPGFVFWMLLGLITSLYMQYEGETQETGEVLCE